MLNDSTDFPFTSALSGDSSLAPQLTKTPEKLLRSIPPNSMQVSCGIDLFIKRSYYDIFLFV